METQQKMQQKMPDWVNRKPTIIIGLLLFAIPLWIWLVVPPMTKLPKDFSYRADVVSLDNLYDEAKKEYSGEKRSVTSFSYEVVEGNQGNLVVKNIFDVRSITGDKIFAVERLYGIDPKTGKHVAGFGDHDRDGYLFAPRNLKYGQPFTYWHINYDGPAHMVFAGEENLFGLPVYRYEARYEGVKIDQTANLGFLPGVGKTRGVELEPYLKLWIEPTSGHLVKYKDDTIAYYYDLSSGAKQNPWNHFSNTYTRESTLAQVHLAKMEKLTLITITIIIPVLLLLFGIVALLYQYHKKSAAILMTLGLLCTLVFSAFQYGVFSAREEPLKIGIARWADNLEYEPSISAFKEALLLAGYKEGTDIDYREPPSAEGSVSAYQKIVQDFVDSEVSLIYTLTTPGTLAAQAVATQIPIVFSIVTYPVESGIVGSLTSSGNNMVGVRNWVPVKDQLSVLLELVPQMRTVGFIHDRSIAAQLIETREAAKSFGVGVIDIPLTDTIDIEDALGALTEDIEAIFMACDPLIQLGESEDRIIAFAQKYALPSLACLESAVRKGALVGDIAEFSEVGKLAGEKAALILSGATPTSLQTDTVVRSFLYINKKTADMLGIPIPQDLRMTAKEIVQ